MGCCASYDCTPNSSFMKSLDKISYSNTKDKDSIYGNSNFSYCCFNGNGVVKLINGKKRVRELKKGDILDNGGKIKCLIEMPVNSIHEVVIIKGALFTPHHPIKINNSWKYPSDIYPVTKKYIDSFFNVVLENIHEININGIDTITLGHNRHEERLEHSYFGTNKVIKDLQKYSTYKDGYIKATCLKAKRGDDGKVKSLF